MPVDLKETDSRITIANRSGDVLPFSRGILASSLLATGIPTEEAYALASVVQTRLLGASRGQIDAEKLVEIIHQILLDAQSEQAAARWLAWRRAKRSGRPVVVVFSGAPGVGKSTIATRMAFRFGISSVVTSDAIRDVLRTVIPAGVLPELHRSTFELVNPASDSPFTDFSRQSSAVATATAAVAERLSRERRSAILEGVHLTPGLIREALSSHPADPIVIERLIVERSEDGHLAKLERRAVSQPLRHGGRHVADIDKIRAIQAHLQDMADRNGIRTIDTENLAIATHEVVDEIASRIEHGRAAA